MECFRPNVRLKLSWISLNILIAKCYLAEPDIGKYDRNNKPQYDLILGVKTIKKYGIILDFKDKMITFDESSCQFKTSTIYRALAPSMRLILTIA